MAFHFLCVKGDFHLNCGLSPLSLLKGARAEILLHAIKCTVGGHIVS